MKLADMGLSIGWLMEGLLIHPAFMTMPGRPQLLQLPLRIHATPRGGANDDTYYVDNTGDVVDASYFGSGLDVVRSSNVSLNLSDPAHFLGDVDNVLLDGALNLNATGNSLDNRLTGNTRVNALSGGAGKDILDGKGGADKINGGADNDTFHADDAGDKVNEAVGGGTDKVYATTSYKLAAAAEVETLRTTLPAGVDAINLTGSD